MYIGSFIQEVHWINASKTKTNQNKPKQKKRNQFCSKLYKKYIFVFIERCRKGDGQILTNNISSFSLFRKKSCSNNYFFLKEKQSIYSTINGEERKIAFVNSFSWFGNQGEGLRLEQGMMGMKGLVEGQRGRQHGGVQRGEGDWPGEDGCV